MHALLHGASHTLQEFGFFGWRFSLTSTGLGVVVALSKSRDAVARLTAAKRATAKAKTRAIGD